MSKILICGLNWLGDGIMSMPAVRAYKQLNPDASITMLVKKSMSELWGMCEAVDEIMVLDPGLAGLLRAAEHIAGKGYDEAYIFPNSWRSGLSPMLAGIPIRKGAGGNGRNWMLSDIVKDSSDGQHQSSEYFKILGFDVSPFDMPLLTFDGADDIRKKFITSGKPVVAIMPGAAFGKAKMWPKEHFIGVAKKLINDKSCYIAVMGVASEKDLCKGIADELKEDAVCLAGKTSLMQSSAILAGCSAVVCNDSGGMHLAAAAGARVVAVYGITDPEKTGPMGSGHKLIMAEGVERARDLERDSSEAIKAMESIKPDVVYDAVVEVLG
ncbi:lipopolysaccharide heptosyltransferase II [bacterium E08(2017)]|nr:lipopolysaccharide heptosyltransferase II [bacterium E08(2017)]